MLEFHGDPALQVADEALDSRWDGDLSSQCLVEELAPLAAIDVTDGAVGGLTRLQQLWIWDMNSGIETTDRILGIVEIERWAQVDLAVGGDREAVLAGAAVAHLRQVPEVGQHVDLYGAALLVAPPGGFRHTAKPSLIERQILVGPRLDFLEDYVDPRVGEDQLVEVVSQIIDVGTTYEEDGVLAVAGGPRRAIVEHGNRPTGSTVGVRRDDGHRSRRLAPRIGRTEEHREETVLLTEGQAPRQNGVIHRGARPAGIPIVAVGGRGVARQDVEVPLWRGGSTRTPHPQLLLLGDASGFLGVPVPEVLVSPRVCLVHLADERRPLEDG